MAFWLWIVVNSLMMNHLPPAGVPSTFSTNHRAWPHSERSWGSLLLFLCLWCPASQWQHHHPPAQHCSSMPHATGALQGPPGPWERESGRSMAPATHRPPVRAAWVCLEVLPQLQSDFRHNSAFLSLANNFLISRQHIFMGNLNQKIQKNSECRESTLQLLLHLMCCISCPSWLILLYLDTS